MTLREVLHAHIPTLTRESTVRDAVDKMDVYQFPALVMLNSENEPIAVVTEGDICRAASQNDGVISMSQEPVSSYATVDPTCAHANTEISDALHLMLSKGITVLPVIDEGKFIGMVLRIDLIQAMMIDLTS